MVQHVGNVPDVPRRGPLDHPQRQVVVLTALVPLPEAADLSDHNEWDWPLHLRARGPEALAQIAGPEKGLGFRTAAELLGSQVERIECPNPVGVLLAQPP